MRHPARLIVLGRQGAGKGTQCDRLAAHLGIPHISTGDVFRAEVAEGTPLGRRVKHHIDQGALVPDDLVIDVVAARLGGRVARSGGYLLDGFPRTLAQAQALFEVLGAGAADLAIEIHVPTSVVLPRLSARRICRDCGASSVGRPGVPDPPCARCGGAVGQRKDDTDEAIARRLALYDEESAPMIVWFDSQGLLETVDGTGDPDTVFRRLLDVLRARLPGVVDRAASPGHAGLADAG